MTGSRRNSISEKVQKTEKRKDSRFESRPSVKHVDLDDVYVNELGQFGWFQLRNLLLVGLPLIFSAFPNEYVFGAAAVPHRCRIPECGESSKSEPFQPVWIENAIPKEDKSEFSSCSRYQPIGNGTLDYCPATSFNQSVVVECDGFVYERNNSVVFEFDIGCNEWLRALAGTLNSVGTLLVLPITGFISDRYGRRVALIINVLNLASIGLLRAFSINYSMYVVLHLLQTTLGAGTASTAYVYGAELVGPKYRVLATATCSSMFATGQVVLGAIAWQVQPWRQTILALHIPCFVIITYYWLMPESVRWLLSKQKYDEAREVLKKVEKTNNKKINEKSLEALMTRSVTEQAGDKSESSKPSLVQAIISSPVLLRRVCTTPIWWVTTTLVYYGLSINSTSLSSTMYLNYILTCAIEIPGYYTAAFVLNKIGRKTTLSCGFFLSAICNFTFIFLPSSLESTRLLFYLVGKFGISAVFTSLYLYTSELYPTEYRHTFLGFSSMIGRVGSITAPMTPVLASYWTHLPSVMFCTMGFLSGLLVLTQPETLGKNMPDTLEEAENLGKPVLEEDKS